MNERQVIEWRRLDMIDRRELGITVPAGLLERLGGLGGYDRGEENEKLRAKAHVTHLDGTPIDWEAS